MAPHLVALTDGPDIALTKPIVLIGRHQECDIQIPSRKISRRHCCIAQVNKYLVVRDLGSTNGIRINGARANEGKLHAGDELTIGNMRYEVRWLENGAAAVPVAAPANAVKAAEAPRGMLDSADQPVAIPEASQDPPLRARPAEQPPKDKGVPPFPEHLNLIPLDSSKFPSH